MWYHGGPSNLPINSYILPPKETGITINTRPEDAEKVFVTTDRSIAKIYAARVYGVGGAPGSVYLVWPESELHRDPDEYRAAYCSRARILWESMTGITEDSLTPEDYDKEKSRFWVVLLGRLFIPGALWSR